MSAMASYPDNPLPHGRQPDDQLPPAGSTLFMLVSALMGLERMRRAYRALAVKKPGEPALSLPLRLQVDSAPFWDEQSAYHER